MKKLFSRNKIIIIIFVLVTFLLFCLFLNRISAVYGKIKKFSANTVVIAFSGLNRSEREYLYKNDELFCLIDDDCTTHGKFACPTAINKYYLAEHAKDYTNRSRNSLMMTGLYCFYKDVVCIDRKCVVEK